MATITPCALSVHACTVIPRHHPLSPSPSPLSSLVLSLGRRTLKSQRGNEESKQKGETAHAHTRHHSPIPFFHLFAKSHPPRLSDLVVGGRECVGGSVCTGVSSVALSPPPPSFSSLRAANEYFALLHKRKGRVQSSHSRAVCQSLIPHPLHPPLLGVRGLLKLEVRRVHISVCMSVLWRASPPHFPFFLNNAP